jgi:hypothetical protein
METMQKYIVIKAELNGKGDLFPEPPPSGGDAALEEMLKGMTEKEIKEFAKATIRTDCKGFRFGHR